MPKRAWGGASRRAPQRWQRGSTYRAPVGRALFTPRFRGRRAGFYRKAGYYGKFNRGATSELKFHDVDYDDSVVAAGAVVNTAGSLNLIAQGVTESTRVGRKCTIMSIGCRYDITLPQIADSSPGFGDVIRVIVYLDKQTNGAIAANTDILETADYQSFNNLSNKSRFRILHDKTFDMNYVAGGGDATANSYAGGAVTNTWFKKCSIPLEFSSTTGALTELRSNNINIMVCSKHGISGIASKWRFRFSDV